MNSFRKVQTSVLKLVFVVVLHAVPAFAAAPGAPTVGIATAGNARATVTFTAPASDGGGAISGYTVISSPAGGIDSNAGTTGTRHIVTGLTNGTTYTFTVTATNNDGTSSPSGASNSITTRPYAPTTGTINNLVVFIRFSDQPEFTQPLSYYDGLFNSAGNSLKNFYLESSYNALTVNSTLYPSSGGSVISYQDSHPTSYYMPYNASTNPVGYQGAEGTARETALVSDALNAISAQIPAGLDLDGDNDGYIDHICFEVYSTVSNPLPVMFYSRATYDTSGGIVLKGKHVGSYTWVTASQDDPEYYLAATEIHEMGHSVGYPDLRANSGRTPVGDWDVMSLATPVHSGAYMKYIFTNWISNISEITSYGAYSINDITQPTNNSYKIKLPNNEFLILEYRKAAGPFESNLPGSGLCITRINEAAGMWGNLGGPPFFLYYYRADGTTSSDGIGANFVCLNAESGRTQFNDYSNPACFLSDGSACGISIYNIGSASGSSINFSVGDPDSTIVTHLISGYLYDGGNRVSGATVTLSGDANNVATTDSLGRYLFTVNAGGNYTITPTKANLTFSPNNQTFTNVTGDQTQNFSATYNKNTISGTITSSGTPLSGVTISCSSFWYITQHVTTDSSGTYTFTVDAGFDYTVQASKPNYFFSPYTKTFTNVTTNQAQDFAMWTATVNLTGTVTYNGSALSGANVSCPGTNTTNPITTNGSGTYAFTVTVGNGSTYTVTPTSSLYTFSPINRFYTGLVSSQVQNFTAQFISSTTLVSSANPIAPGQSVTFTATVAGSTPTGTVTFNDGITAVCSAVPLSNGQAQCSTSSLGASSHSIVAVYSGDGNNTGSTSATLTQVVAPLPTIWATPLTSGTVDTPYSGFDIHSTNATSVTVTNNLPPGVTFRTTTDPDSGLITYATMDGMPTTAGVYSNIVITAHNSVGSANLQAFSITIKLHSPTIAGYPATVGMVGKPYNIFTPTATYASSFSITGTLPPGLNFDTATGILSGTPTTAGTYNNLIITAINNDGSTPLQAFTVRVSPEIDRFTAAGSMKTARQYHTATLLPNGMVLVTGGVDADYTSLSSAELYDPATDSWSSAGAMTDARSFHTATLLQNGLVLVAGGSGSSGLLGSAELYDPVNDSWLTTQASVMANAHSSHTATLLADGNVLVAGGIDPDLGIITAVELYNPTAKSWTTVSPMSELRFGNTATLLSSGKVLVAGGDYITNSAELYDPQGDSWSAAGATVSPHSGHTGTSLSSGKVLVAGGYDFSGNHDSSSAEVYDPATDSWSAVSSMATVRQSHRATLLSDGRVLVTGGSYNYSGILTFAELYDPTTAMWSAAGSMLTPRSNYSATLLPNGNVLVAGGSDGTTALASTELFNYAYAIKTTAGPGGSIFCNPARVKYGSSSNCTISPDTAYEIDTVTIDGVLQSPASSSYTFNNVTAAHTIEVTFADKTGPLTTASPAGGTYSSAQNVTLLCNDNGGSGCVHTFYCTGMGCTPKTNYTGNVINISGSTDLRFFSTDNAANVENVKTETYIFTHALTVNKTGSGVAGGGGTYGFGTTHQVTATANPGSTFSGWSGDCSGTVSPFDVAMLDRDMTCTATFIPNRHTLTITKTGNGVVLADNNPLPWNNGTSSASYNEGVSVGLSAAADQCFTFDGWSGDYQSNVVAGSLLMDKDWIITATFSVNLPAYDVTTQTEYSTLAGVYQGAADGDSIELQAGSFNEALQIDKKGLTITGGVDCDYNLQDGATTIKQLVIKNGSAVVDRIIIQ